MKDCVFCKIVAGELPSQKLFETDDILGILDRYPIIPGQALLISKKHETSYFANMPDKLSKNFLKLGKKTAKAITKGLGIKRTTFMIEGLDIDHAHIKIFPVYSLERYAESMGSGKQELTNEQLKHLADKIRKEVDFNAHSSAQKTGTIG
jgi:histidine triad (HIT) family protein